MNQSATVEAMINAPVKKVWDYYTMPEHLVHWNNASEDWHTPRAENDLKAGGRFLSRMESKDGKEGFDFTGTYDEVIEHSVIKYTMDKEEGDENDARKVTITMNEENGQTKISVTFDLENVYPAEFQKEGWQSILDNFKKYVEAN